LRFGAANRLLIWRIDGDSRQMRGLRVHITNEE
jgi:hypothetical protein